MNEVKLKSRELAVNHFRRSLTLSFCLTYFVSQKVIYRSTCLTIHDYAMYKWMFKWTVSHCRTVNCVPFFGVCALVCCLGLSQEKASAFVKRFRSEPRYLLAQNVSTCIDPLEVCLHRQTVQDTVHIFQHSIPTEGKPVTNQKNSGTYTKIKFRT